jgi:RimJ/RimL family protein N-acetyltransferase
MILKYTVKAKFPLYNINFYERLDKCMLTHVGTVRIETKRLILRKFQYTDDENMLKYWISDPKIQSLCHEPVS